MKKTTNICNTELEAMKVAKANQKPGQTKEQTKLIAQGIEKGIAEYKKQQKAKSRERDKVRKTQLKQKSLLVEEQSSHSKKASSNVKYLIALGGSWIFFILYIAIREL